MRLLNGARVDVALVQWGSTSENVHMIKLPPFEAICVMPEDHRLARQKYVRVGALEGEHLIAMHKHSPLRIRTDAALLHAGVKVHRRLESSVSASICELVHLGFGVAVTNPFSIHHVRPHGITWRPFKPALPYEMAIALPRHRTRPKLLDDFIDHLETELTRFARIHTPA